MNNFTFEPSLNGSKYLQQPLKTFGAIYAET